MKRGALAVVPFSFGVLPFAVAFAVAARSAGFSPLEIQALSMLVFAGAAQMAAVSMFATGAGAIAIVLTTFVINLRHVVYGLSLDRELPRRTRPPRPVLAFLLIDESYGLTMAERMNGRGGDAYYVGASLCFYVLFVSSTAIGIVLGSVIPDLERLGLDFIFPLVFVSLLAPLVTGARHLAVAVASAGIASASILLGFGGPAVLVATVGGAALGTLLERD